MIKKGYADLLRQISEDHENRNSTLDKDSKVLIVDGLNSFIRVWVANPLVNDNGEHIGGYIGFLRSIGAVIRQFKPTRCIITFDGKGGSARRKKMHSGYKEGRKMSTRFNRREDIGEQSVETELESMRLQMGKLSQYLQALPITLISIDNIEADDTIAYLTTEVFRPKGSEIIIMSDDKDFMQLIDDKTSVWRPVEKKFYTPKEVLARFGVPTHNFIHYKIFMGDASDNIKGINGVGIKTLQSKFPILLGPERVGLDELFEYCNARVNEHKIYKTCVDNKDVLKLNWDLMSLEDLDISGNFKSIIADIAARPIPSLDAFNFKKMIMMDKAYTALPNPDSFLLQTFSSLTAFAGEK
jgi:5'-3' exonuclease